MDCGLFNNIVPTLTSGFRSLYYAYGKMVTLGSWVKDTQTFSVLFFKS